MLLDWIGLDWIGLDCIGMGWYRLETHTPVLSLLLTRHVQKVHQNPFPVSPAHPAHPGQVRMLPQPLQPRFRKLRSPAARRRLLAHTFGGSYRCGNVVERQLKPRQEHASNSHCVGRYQLQLRRDLSSIHWQENKNRHNAGGCAAEGSAWGVEEREGVGEVCAVAGNK